MLFEKDRGVPDQFAQAIDAEEAVHRGDDNDAGVNARRKVSEIGEHEGHAGASRQVGPWPVAFDDKNRYAVCDEHEGVGRERTRGDDGKEIRNFSPKADHCVAQKVAKRRSRPVMKSGIGLAGSQDREHADEQDEARDADGQEQRPHVQKFLHAYSHKMAMRIIPALLGLVKISLVTETT